MSGFPHLDDEGFCAMNRRWQNHAKPLIKKLWNSRLTRNTASGLINLAKELVLEQGDVVITVEIEHVLEEFVEGQIDHIQLSRELQKIAGGPTLH